MQNLEKKINQVYKILVFLKFTEKDFFKMKIVKKFFKN